MAKRTLKMHEHLLHDIILRQAGTISKAILEGAMNSYDAKSPECHIKLTSNTLEIKDSGKGFQNEQEIDKWFETFGQPHEESEQKTYGTFRMGRGQLFAFGRNIWRSNNFKMDVDFKHEGLHYDLTTKEKVVNGCQIKIELYEKLMPSDLADIKREVERFVKYMPMNVTLNGKRISVDLEKEKWDHVTPEGYVKLKRTGDLEVYNLGVFVRGYSNYKYGTGGVVVSKEQLKVNFARNDVMQSECKVWKKLRQFVNAKSTKNNVKREELNEDERKNLAISFVYGELSVDEVKRAKIFTDVKGKHFALDKFRTDRRSRLTFCKKHDYIGDKIHQQKLALVLAEENLERFECTEQELLDLINNSGICWNEWELIPFAQLSADFSDLKTLVDPSEWTAYENIAIDLIHRSSHDITWELNGKDRKALLGQSETATAWTDGQTFIAYDRQWIRNNFQPLNIESAMIVAGVMLHEYCHDSSDSTGHGHPTEFYEKFHDNRNLICKVAQNMVNEYAMALENAGKAITKKFAKLQDQIVKNEDAIRKLNEKIAKSDETKKKHAALVETKEQLKAPKSKRKVAPKKEKVAPKKKIKKADTENLYRGKYGILYEHATQWIDKDVLLETVSEITGQTTKQVKMALSVLGNPNHRSNQGKTKREVKGNKIRIVRA